MTAFDSAQLAQLKSHSPLLVARDCMSVKIRLARFGRTHWPSYRLFIANSWAKRDGKHLEQVGSYNPKPDIHGHKYVTLNVERIKYWLAQGAQPTDTVARLLGKVRLMQSFVGGNPSLDPPWNAHCSQAGKTIN